MAEKENKSDVIWDEYAKVSNEDDRLDMEYGTLADMGVYIFRTAAGPLYYLLKGEPKEDEKMAEGKITSNGNGDGNGAGTGQYDEILNTYERLLDEKDARIKDGKNYTVKRNYDQVLNMVERMLTNNMKDAGNNRGQLIDLAKVMIDKEPEASAQALGLELSKIIQETEKKSK